MKNKIQTHDEAGSPNPNMVKSTELDGRLLQLFRDLDLLTEDVRDEATLQWVYEEVLKLKQTVGLKIGKCKNNQRIHIW